MRVRGEVVPATAIWPNSSITVKLLLATHRAASIGEATSRVALVRLVERVRMAVSRWLASTRDSCQVAIVVVGLADCADVQLRVQSITACVATNVGGLSHMADAAT